MTEVDLTDQKRNKLLQMTCTEKELKEFHTHAKELGLNVPNLIRTAVKEYVAGRRILLKKAGMIK